MTPIVSTVILMLFSGILGYIHSRILKWDRAKTLLIISVACASWVGYISLEVYNLAIGSIDLTWHLSLSTAVLFINSVVLLFIVIRYSLHEDISWPLFQISVASWPIYLIISLFNFPIYIALVAMV